MKKFLSIAAVLAMITVTAISVSAAEVTPQTEENASTSFSYEYKFDPSYTVTIPSQVTLTTEGTPVEIKAENIANLDGKKVSVTIAGTDYFRNQMVLQGESDKAAKPTLRYQFIMPDESVVETTGGKDQVNGVELASFTEDGSTTFTVKPVLNNPSTPKGVKYSGTMTYAVALTDAE